MRALMSRWELRRNTPLFPPFVLGCVGLRKPAIKKLARGHSCYSEPKKEYKMKVLENGKTILEQGETPYDAVLLEVAHVKGVAKESNKAYDFVKVRLDLQCVTADGELRTKPAEVLADSADLGILQSFEQYKPVKAIFCLGYDPTSSKAGKFVGLVMPEKLHIPLVAQK